MEQKAGKTQKRPFKLPFSAVLLYLFLIAAALFGVTFSKYVTKTAVGDTARVAYIKDIAIEEEGNFVGQNQWIITPGVKMVKHATVKFEGSEMACYVFLEIKTTGWTRSGKHAYACSIDGTDALTFGVDTDWIFLSGDNSGAVYYRIVFANTPLSAEVLADGGSIAVSPALTRTQLDTLPADMAIHITAAAVQYHGISETPGADSAQQRAETAWSLVKDR